MQLSQYLASVAGQHWLPGALDCCTFMADWLMSQGYPDPMADRRGTYSDKMTFRKMLKSEGGIVRSCESRFGKIGLRGTANLSSGDVALVMTPFAIRRGRVLSAPAGAICVKEKTFAVITSDIGLVITSELPFVAGWSING